MDPAAKPRLSEQEYLDLERASATKHELVNGELVAMAGASRRHNLIAGNIARALGNALAKQPCIVLSSDQRVAVSTTGLFTYPDVTVLCGRPETHPRDADTLLNPTVLVEVLSESTEAYDRGPKFAHYQRLSSLRHYVMIAQSGRRVEHYARVPGSGWLLVVTEGEGAISFDTLGVTITLDEIYDKLDLLEP